MEVLFGKVYAVASNKNKIIKIYSNGKHIHDFIDCPGENCSFESFFTRMNILLNDNFKERETVRIEFINIVKDHIQVFTLIYQMTKKFGEQIFHLDIDRMKKCITYEFDKTKYFLKIILKSRKLTIAYLF